MAARNTKRIQIRRYWSVYSFVGEPAPRGGVAVGYAGVLDPMLWLHESVGKGWAGFQVCAILASHNVRIRCT